MELPQYHIPAAKNVLLHTWERCFAFIKKVATVLFLVCVVMWYLSTYGIGAEGYGMVEPEDSFIASMGGAIAWIFAPLGFGEWQAVAASISGFVAKEAIVSTIGRRCKPVGSNHGHVPKPDGGVQLPGVQPA